MYVCRNNVDERDWPRLIERDGPIRVGWMGSPSHIWDVDIAWNALRWAKENGAETWMIGLDPIRAMQDRTMKINNEYTFTKSAKKYIAGWKRVGYKYVAWRQPEQYERLALPLDIGLCPLVTNAHTLGKSDCKFLEYTISGAATVAQNNLVYNRTIKHGETGLLAGSPHEFIDCVARLMKDEKLRLELVANAQQYVRENRGVKQMKQEWMAAIEG
jgi:glycosyltransferase involved in cell wall biosynthesis